jgi:hypothetical protein
MAEIAKRSRTAAQYYAMKTTPVTNDSALVTLRTDNLIVSALTKTDSNRATLPNFQALNHGHERTGHAVYRAVGLEAASIGRMFPGKDDRTAPSALPSFPARIEEQPEVLKCGELFVIIDGKTVFAWQ